MGISLIATSHQLNNFMETRDIINGALNVTIFPEDEIPQSVITLAKKHGIPTEAIERLRQKGKWVTIHGTNPQYLLSDREAEMIH
jgi:hypothetical protein